MDHAQLLVESKRYADQMSNRERRLAYEQGEEVDRLPVAISVRENLAPLYGFTQGEYRRDFAVRADVYHRASVDFDCLGVSIGPNLKKIGEALGALAHYPENEPDYLTDQPLTDYRALSGYEPPVPERSPVLRAMLEDMGNYKRRFGEDFPLATEIGGPLSTAISIRPLDLVLLDLVERPERLTELLSFCADCQLAWVEQAHQGYGVTTVTIADPVASLSLISPQMFRNYAAPALSRLVDGVIRITGRRPGLHICGKTAAIWQDLVELGVSSFRVDNCESLSRLKEQTGHHMAIAGNIPPVEIMQQGGIDDVLAAGRRCIAQAADNPGGFTLAAGCQLPPAVSADNLLAMLLAARRYGRGARKGRPCPGAAHDPFI